MAKSELGTKRVDPETGRKFYDLNKDPIVSPYTGKSYPRSYFEEGKIAAMEEDEEVADKEQDAEDEEGAEIVSLEDADEEAKGGDDLPDLGDDDVDLGDDEDDTFLADEEEEDDDVSDMIGVGDDDDEV
ncbi:MULTISPECIES: TIGR02300 family protein [unclassified Mesorhizobium]|uniref:TIGR02300 family protein n=1 Tax=unclassified Mesorhizobium TaxID=325217 RepID=UPI000962F4A5|nr:MULTISPECIES: TIGR02300 family protein [unclassified Mesorhizobium]MBN9255421.1 TIGR02300 family protein [Mesorhizobium sp.]MBN9275654.1 TIGR02300 family protein [Mesorhizobium sp.]OJX78010.1 MAG: TIGR02300 family protein [Mesorhizobium sp. 65-26]